MLDIGELPVFLDNRLEASCSNAVASFIWKKVFQTRIILEVTIQQLPSINVKRNLSPPTVLAVSYRNLTFPLANLNVYSIEIGHFLYP